MPEKTRKVLMPLSKEMEESLHDLTEKVETLEATVDELETLDLDLRPIREKIAYVKKVRDVLLKVSGKS